MKGKLTLVLLILSLVYGGTLTGYIYGSKHPLIPLSQVMEIDDKVNR